MEFRAAFAIGGKNGDGCPQSYSRLKTEAACHNLAAIAGANLYAGSEEYSYYPAGCFRHTVNGNFYWNTHADGANNSFAQPLCAGAPPARTARHARCRNAKVSGCACMPHHMVLGYSAIRRYSGTQYSGGQQGTQ